MFSLFSGFNRLRSLVENSDEFRETVNTAFTEAGYPPPIEGPTALNTDYRIDLSAPPRFVWFQLAEVYIQYLPDKKELTYDVRKRKVTRVGNL